MHPLHSIDPICNSSAFFILFVFSRSPDVVRSQILHFFNTPPSLSEDQLVSIFNHKEVSPIAVRMFPLKTERSSSGLIEFPSVAEAVIAIMKCNHIPVENKGDYCKQPFFINLSSTESLSSVWNRIIGPALMIIIPSHPQFLFRRLLVGTKFPFIMKLCFSSSKSMNNAWNMENIEKMNEDN